MLNHCIVQLLLSYVHHDIRETKAYHYPIGAYVPEPFIFYITLAHALTRLQLID